MEQSKGEITAEQVERAIAKPRNIDYRELPLGWREWAPDYVIAAEAADDWDAEHAALTRWRDELAAAEPVLPTPVEDSPERLRERREGIPWTLNEAAAAVSKTPSNLIGVGVCIPWQAADVSLCEGKSFAGPAYAQCRALYAAALSAEEARRAALTKGPDKQHMLPAFRKAIAEMRAGGASLSEVADAYRLGIGEVSDALDAESMAPERPAPRFKVGDWVAHRESVCGGWQIAKVEWNAECSWWKYADASGWFTSEHHLEPASPPAPEVVDVPQPRIVVKRCDEVEAEWTSADATILIVTHDALDDAIFVPIALLRAMLAAIDAQQGGAS